MLSEDGYEENQKYKPTEIVVTVVDEEEKTQVTARHEGYIYNGRVYVIDGKGFLESCGLNVNDAYGKYKIWKESKPTSPKFMSNLGF